MGVAGSGKTTVAELLAQRAGLEYVEADRFHSPENIAKMSSGTPLTDEDRQPWLRRLSEWMRERREAGVSTVLACSALKRSYRDILRSHAPALMFVHLHGSPELIRERMTSRKGHFMPPALLDSQIRDLEPLQADENGITVDLVHAPDEIAEQALSWLRIAPDMGTAR
ncbi:gluconokinase [Saccharopolyspora erythraea]|nr:gluconokinase [Saccharopolyspora erythraea]QRK93607.1 gluconokinase [Saccharopolyspora erythraea]